MPCTHHVRKRTGMSPRLYAQRAQPKEPNELPRACRPTENRRRRLQVAGKSRRRSPSQLQVAARLQRQKAGRRSEAKPPLPAREVSFWCSRVSAKRAAACLTSCTIDDLYRTEKIDEPTPVGGRSKGEPFRDEGEKPFRLPQLQVGMAPAQVVEQVRSCSSSSSRAFFLAAGRQLMQLGRSPRRASASLRRR